MERKNAGFTLIEIMIVVMIVGLLMATLATQLIGRAQQAQVDLAATQLRQLEQALELYKLDNGRYPSSDQGLEALGAVRGAAHKTAARDLDEIERNFSCGSDRGSRIEALSGDARLQLAYLLVRERG